MENVRYEYFVVTAHQINELVTTRIRSAETAATRKQAYLDKKNNVTKPPSFSKNHLFNELGAKGWELITVENDEFIFKRKIGREAVWALKLPK